MQIDQTMQKNRLYINRKSMELESTINVGNTVPNNQGSQRRYEIIGFDTTVFNSEYIETRKIEG